MPAAARSASSLLAHSLSHPSLIIVCVAQRPLVDSPACASRRPSRSSSYASPLSSLERRQRPSKMCQSFSRFSSHDVFLMLTTCSTTGTATPSSKSSPQTLRGYPPPVLCASFPITTRNEILTGYSQLMGFLKPNQAPYHVRAVRLIWDLEHTTSHRHIESILSQALVSGAANKRYDSYNAFGVFWRLSGTNASSSLCR